MSTPGALAVRIPSLLPDLPTLWLISSPHFFLSFFLSQLSTRVSTSMKWERIPGDCLVFPPVAIWAVQVSSLHAPPHAHRRTRTNSPRFRFSERKALLKISHRGKLRASGQHRKESSGKRSRGKKSSQDGLVKQMDYGEIVLAERVGKGSYGEVRFLSITPPPSTTDIIVSGLISAGCCQRRCSRGFGEARRWR